MRTLSSTQDGDGEELRNATSHESRTKRRAQSIRSSSQRSGYDVPDVYQNLDEVANPPPIQNPDEGPVSRVHSLEERGDSNMMERGSSRGSRRRSIARSHVSNNSGYNIPDNYANLDELAIPLPVENPGEDSLYRHRSLEETRSREQEFQKGERQKKRDSITRRQDHDQEKKFGKQPDQETSRFATQLYTISYLILFSLLGTLARLGLQAITFYPGAPVVFSELWANFGGSLFMGFLSEDRMLFKEEWGVATYDEVLQRAKGKSRDEESGSDQPVELQAAKKAHAATKKTIPLYIGLATGFCGSFTSFSSFIRDAFLAMSNDLSTPLNHPADHGPISSSITSTVHRNGGYSFMALLAVVITTVALCISGLHIGAHIAIALEPFTPSLPFDFTRKILDRLAVFLAWGCWIGAVFLAIFPPDRHNGGSEIWRGRAVFALVFAPLGCLGRFYASLYLNGKIASFPLGTFVANISGTAILGMSYDLQHAPLGGVIGCQVLQGIEDGFCGCLTTVSTWVSELSTLRRTHSYQYGAASVLLALGFLIVIMGSMQWTIGFSALQCTH